MKTKNKTELTLGDLIAEAYRAWGARRAEKMVRWALFARLVVSPDRPRWLSSSTKGDSV